MIYHYNGAVIRLNTKLNHNRLWLEYFFKTPFCTPEAIGNLFADMADRIHQGNRNVNSQNAMFRKFLSSLASRRKVYFVEKSLLEKTIQICGTREGDIIIDSLIPNAMEILLQHLQPSKIPNSTDKRVAIIHVSPNRYGDIRKSLINAGFIPGVDYINIGQITDKPPKISYDTQEMIDKM